MKKQHLLILITLVFTQGLFAQSFNNLERALIQSGNIQSPLPIVMNTHDVGKRILSTASADIDIKDPLLPLLMNRMYLSVRDSANDGVGIAAPQVGINRNLFWVQRFDKKNEPFEFFINPKIVWFSELKQKGPEGCLSIPVIRGDVIRSYAITLTYFTIDGAFHMETIEDFTAVIFQHENDHILGKLFIQRLEDQETKTYTTPPTGRGALFLEKQ